MKIFQLTLIPCSLWAFAFLPSTFAQDDNDCGADIASDPIVLPSVVTLDRVRRCRVRKEKYCSFGKLAHERYKVLDKAVSHARAKDLYLSEVNTPSKSSTKNIAMFFSGQQADLVFPLGGSSATTGQQMSYKAQFFANQKTGSTLVSLSPGSLPQRIFATNLFDKSDTFAGLVFDAQFSYQYRKAKKERTETAYYDYLVGKLGNDVQTIYLAGQCRGGCLVMSLAQKFTTAFPNARVIVQTFDPVCADQRLIGGREMNVDSTVRKFNPFAPTNPTNLVFPVYVYTTDMGDQYPLPTRDCLAIRALLGGYPVVAGLADLVTKWRAFGHNGLNFLTVAGGRSYYQETFHNIIHSQVDQHPATLNAAVAHFLDMMENMACPCGSAGAPFTPPSPAPTVAPTPRPCCNIRTTYVVCESIPGVPQEHVTYCCPDGDSWGCAAIGSPLTCNFGQIFEEEEMGDYCPEYNSGCCQVADKPICPNDQEAGCCPGKSGWECPIEYGSDLYNCDSILVRESSMTGLLCDTFEDKGGAYSFLPPSLEQRAIEEVPGIILDRNVSVNVLNNIAIALLPANISDNGPIPGIDTDYIFDTSKTCCNANAAPPCFFGPALCCPSGGQWTCRSDFSSNYQCPSGDIIKRDEQGLICGQHPWQYTIPVWYEAVKATHANVQMCYKRPFPPTSGTTCAKRQKTCFWGNQQCAVGAYPTTKCSCDGTPGNAGIWSCEAQACPNSDGVIPNVTVTLVGPDTAIPNVNITLVGPETTVPNVNITLVDPNAAITVTTPVGSDTGVAGVDVELVDPDEAISGTNGTLVDRNSAF